MFKRRIAGRPLPVIFLTIFVDLLGFGILIPVIPQLLANPSSEYFLLPSNMTTGQGFILLGFLTATFSIAQFIATPILGQLSDRFGRRKLLAISLTGTLISYLIFAYGIATGNLIILFLARFLDGVTGGNIAVAQAAIADVSTPENRAKNFGLIGAAFGLGFIIGPYIGGKLSDPSIVPWFSATTPFLFAALLSFINVISIIIFFPETLKEKNHNLKIKWTRSLTNIYHASINKELRMIFATVFLFTAGFTFFTTFFSVYLIDKFNFSQGDIGDFFAYIGLWVAFTQAVLTGRVSKRFPAYRIIRYGILVSGIAIFLYLLPEYWWQLLFIVPIFAIGNGLASANITALVSRSSGAEIQGEVLGINSSVQALAMSFPPILSGFIAASISPYAPILIAGGIIISAGAFFWIFYKPHKIQQVHAE